MEFFVTYESKKYDIQPFIDRHPAGADIIKPYRNKDITEAFNEVGHSNFAKKTMLKYLVEAVATEPSHEADDTRSLIAKRLFTKEDPYYLHKSLGLINLLIYLYRYALVVFYNTLGFDGILSYFTIFSIVFANLLSASSLIFHVIPTRMQTNPLIIYEEYRLHAILFTLRATGVCLLSYFWGDADLIYILPLFTLVIHLLVDYVSSIHATYADGKRITTVRNGEEHKFRVLKLFYAFYQITIMATHLVPSSDLANLGYNGIIAIHSSAFLMTLKRKGIIRWKAHAFWYTLALLLSLYYVYLSKGGMFLLIVLFFFILRTQLNINKYVVWALYLIIYHLQFYNSHLLFAYEK